MFKEFSIRNLCEYHDFYVQSDMLLLEDAFKNFRNKCIKICEFELPHFLCAPGLAWQAALRKTGAQLELLIDNYMLLMVKKNRCRICLETHSYAKTNNKYIKNYDQNIESSYLMCLDGNNLYGWAISQ